MSRTITVVINNCMDCQYNFVASAPVSKERYAEIVDEMAFGKKSNPFRKEPLSVYCSKYRTSDNPSSHITTYTPPVSLDKIKSQCEIPEWCPLIVVE